MAHLSKEQIEAVLKRARGPRPRVYVETGTYRGRQLAVAVTKFPRVIGVELDRRFAELSSKAAPTASVICGNTSDVLPELAKDLSEPVFFYLDAHFCKTDPPITSSRFPLWDELIILRARPYPDIVVIDDLHTFGRKRPELSYKGAPDWEGVTPASISSFLGVEGFKIADGFVVCR
jgi:hypothetical protein